MRGADAHRPRECGELTFSDPVNAGSWRSPASLMRGAGPHRRRECGELDFPGLANAGSWTSPASRMRGAESRRPRECGELTTTGVSMGIENVPLFRGGEDSARSWGQSRVRPAGTGCDVGAGWPELGAISGSAGGNRHVSRPDTVRKSWCLQTETPRTSPTPVLRAVHVAGAGPADGSHVAVAGPAGGTCR